MKFFHLSDLHIGLKLIGRDLAADQEYILNEIVRKAGERRPDAVVIAGDIYDRAVPSAEAVDMFDRFITALAGAVPEAAIMVISGNHDSPARINLMRELLTSRRVYMIGHPPVREDEYIEKVTLTDAYGEVHFYLLPFVRPSMVRLITGYDDNGNSLTYDEAVRRLIAREKIDTAERNVLVSHQFYLPAGKEADEIERMDSEIRTVGNIDEVGADILQPFDYAALGHIHKPMSVGSNEYRYCGTPLACSSSEAGQEKGIIEVEIGPKGSVRTEVIPLIPLRQVRIVSGTLSEVLMKACDDYITVELENEAGNEQGRSLTETWDPSEIYDRIREAFPNLLEIRRKDVRGASYDRGATNAEAVPDPVSLCTAFLNDLDDTELSILTDVINSVMGGSRDETA